MTISLYMDEQIPKAITLGLRKRGIDVLTVQEDNRSSTPDIIVLDRATQLGRIIFTQDDDFLIEAHRRQLENIKFGGVIYGHQRNVSVGDCVHDLELIAKVSEPEDFINFVQYLPL
jgi:hypothetical protein